MKARLYVGKYVYACVNSNGKNGQKPFIQERIGDINKYT